MRKMTFKFNRFLKDREAGEKWLSIWWFLILVIIALAIIGAINMFFNANIDTRAYEASLLYDKTFDCVSNNYNFMNFGGENFDLITACGLNSYLFTSEEGLKYYIEVYVKDEDGNIIGDKASVGRESYKGDCEVLLGDEKIIAKNFPFCFQKSEVVNFVEPGESKIKTRQIEILIASNQKGGKV